MKKYRSRTKSKAGSRDRHAGSKTDPGREARPISSLTVTAWARRADKTNWQKQLEFEDRDGDLHRILISNAKARNGTWLFDTLDGAGCPLPTDDAAFKELKQSIIKADPKRRLLIVERPGWHGARFLLGNESIGKGTEELVLASNIQPHCARVTQRGSLKDWVANIAEPSACSSYLVFALCVAFAAPLLRLTNTES